MSNEPLRNDPDDQHSTALEAPEDSASDTHTVSGSSPLDSDTDAPADEEPDADATQQDVEADAVPESSGGQELPDNPYTDTAGNPGQEIPVDEVAYSEEESPTADTVVIEHLAPALSRKALLVAAGVAAGVSLLVGIIPAVVSTSAEPVGISTVTVEPGEHSVSTNSSDSVREALDSVYRISTAYDSGSSYLVDPTTLATNAHVATVDVGEEVTVTSRGGTSFKGEVIMRDEFVDTALVRIPEQSSKPLPFVTVKEQEAGQSAYLAGYPINLPLTLTSGIVSAVDTVTNLNESPGQHSLLQIDAAVNPGSSGGPILDEHGRVMGMITSRPDKVDGRVVQGVGFGVPANDVSIAIRQFNEHGNVDYGYLGVAYVGTSNELRHVTPRTPASAAGLERGDRITAVNGFPTNDYTQVSRHLLLYRSGEGVTFTIERGGETSDIDIVLAKRK